MNTFYRIGNEFTSRTNEENASSDRILSVALDSIRQFGAKWDVHLPVFLTAASLARILWLDTVYQKGLDVPGQIVEFGSQWGASLNTFLLLKMIREPWNMGRIINSFSTFSEGFVSIEDKDGEAVRTKDYAVAHGWEDHLKTILESHAARSPIGASNNFRVIPGDAAKTFPQWLTHNPEALISHAHFDMDVYEPTREILALCLPRMPKGAVLIFDELSCAALPGNKSGRRGTGDKEHSAKKEPVSALVHLLHCRVTQNRSFSFLDDRERKLLLMNLRDCKIVDLPKVNDARGNLTFIEGGRQVPFDIKRVYYLYDVPGGAERGGHAHKNLHQLIIALSGSFDVVLDDGTAKKRFHLNRSYYGVYICPMIWRALDNFSSASVCVVLASNLYDEADYYRDYHEFVRARTL